MRSSLLLALAACAPGTAVLSGGTDPTGSTVPIGEETSDGPTGSPSGSTSDPEPTAEAPDYRLAGPHPTISDTRVVDTSCDMETYTVRPDGVAPVALVVLAHGFARSRAQVEGWADHWATWGVAVAAPDLCESWAWDASDHVDNAQDLVDLADAIAPGTPVIYAGHGVGALAAWLAAGDDADAIGHVGLDLTDTDDGLALGAAPDLAVPTYGLLAEPETCNEDANGEGAYAAAATVRAIRVVGADHCDFESPTDWGCDSFCADGAGADATVHDAILGLSTAAIVGLAGDPVAFDWWTPERTWFDQLDAAGVIEPVTW